MEPKDLHLGTAEARFAGIVWANAPVSTTELVKLCAAEFSWKRTTTYTVLKRLCDRWLFQTHSGTVTVLVSREQFYAAQSEQFVADRFGGSLPAFVAAFTSQKKLSAKDLAEIRAMIDAMGEE